MKKLKRDIEVEVRSFISKQKYNQLLKYFKKEAKFLGEDNQITYYFSGTPDLRVQKNKNFARIWLKKGKIHDKFREEIEVKFDRKDFEKLKNIFSALGFKEEILWLRKRNEFLWKNIRVCLDFTQGYGFIIELEKITSKKNRKEVYKLLLKNLEKLSVKLTAKKVFEEKFNFYKKKWRKILRISYGKTN